MFSILNNRINKVYKGVSRKIITYTILFSSIITLIITAISIYNRYDYDIQLIDSRFKQIEKVHLPSLNNNLWLADKSELLVHMQGIIQISDIQYLEVKDKDQLWASVGVKKTERIKTKIFPMTYTYKDKTLNIGTLRVDASLETVYNNIYHELGVTLASNAIKTFLVAFFMMFIFYQLVVRHLHKIAEDITEYNIAESDKILKLERKDNSGDNKDEFDLVVDAFNQLQYSLRKSFESIEEQVEIRTKELVAAKTEAINASSAKSEFMSRMSHELRTPMNAILGFSQLLELAETLEDEQKEHVNEILSAGHHLLELINELLDLSRIESGNMELQLEYVSLNLVIDETVTLVQPLLQSQGITLVRDKNNQNELFVMAEKFRLKQVIINLLSNAIKYNQPDGKIFITIELINDFLRLNIIDTGNGLTEEQSQNVFEPFNRAGAENTAIEGTGIGLTISKRLMELMGGKIGVKSSLNKGSCFFVDLKLHNKKPDITAQATPSITRP